MTLFLPLVLLAPVMLLAVAVLALAAHGPVGWFAAALLLLAVGWSCRRVWRVTRAWWARTKAPERTHLVHPHPHRRHAP